MPWPALGPWTHGHGVSTNHGEERSRVSSPYSLFSSGFRAAFTHTTGTLKLVCMTQTQLCVSCVTLCSFLFTDFTRLVCRLRRVCASRWRGTRCPVAAPRPAGEPQVAIFASRAFADLPAGSTLFRLFRLISSQPHTATRTPLTTTWTDAK